MPGRALPITTTAQMLHDLTASRQEVFARFDPRAGAVLDTPQEEAREQQDRDHVSHASAGFPPSPTWPRVRSQAQPVKEWVPV